MPRNLRRFWVCTVKHQHQWDVTEAEARRSVFLRADCELCGEVIDATKLVRLLDALRERDSHSRVRGIIEHMARGFKNA
jgi:hypothetical protein